MGLFSFLNRKKAKPNEFIDPKEKLPTGQRGFEIGKWYQLVNPKEYARGVQISIDECSEDEFYINLLYIKPTTIMSVNADSYLIGVGVNAEYVDKNNIRLYATEWHATEFSYGKRVKDFKYEPITDAKMIKKLECLIEKKVRDEILQEKRKKSEEEKFKKDLTRKLLKQNC